MDQNAVDIQAIEQKVDNFKVALHKKVFPTYTAEQVSAAVDVAIGVLPRVKNYFTKIEKSFRLITQPAKTQLVVKLTKYSLEHPEVSIQALSYSLKDAAEVKVIPDDKLAELLDDGTFEIKTAKGGAREPKDYDFVIPQV